MMIVLRGVPVDRRVAAADVSAAETKPQVNPFVTHLKAFLASIAARLDLIRFFQNFIHV
jgi:hypothetical protein